MKKVTVKSQSSRTIKSVGLVFVLAVSVLSVFTISSAVTSGEMVAFSPQCTMAKTVDGFPLIIPEKWQDCEIDKEAKKAMNSDPAHPKNPKNPNGVMCCGKNSAACERRIIKNFRAGRRPALLAVGAKTNADGSCVINKFRWDSAYNFKKNKSSF